MPRNVIMRQKRKNKPTLRATLKALSRWRAPRGKLLTAVWMTVFGLMACTIVYGQTNPGAEIIRAVESNQDADINQGAGIDAEWSALGGPPVWTSPEGLSSSLQVMLLLTVLSLAPAVLLMTTSFIRIVVVLGLLRQAMGTQQLPPGQVITSIAMFMTLLIMTPVWTEVYNEAIAPYSDPESGMSPAQAWDAGVRPIRRFMSLQIKNAHNRQDVWLFYRYHASKEATPPKSYAEVPLQVLIPAYMLSELKVAFMIGFQIYLPFLILDIVVASITISMGMLMLPPVMISLPFKLLLFVLVDGWNLVVGMLLESFVPYT